MKTKYFLLIFSGLLLLCACNKDKDLLVKTPSFDVTGYTIQDGIDSLGNPVKQVVFNMEGNADVISFYSGEVFHEYIYKDGHIIGTDAVKVSFAYEATVNHASTPPEWEQLSVQAATSFNGTVTAEGEGWTDITARFSLLRAQDMTGRVETSADISDLAVPGQPLYIAFKYITPAGRPVSNAYTTWDIFNFKVSQETLLGSAAVVDQTIAALPLYLFGPNDADDPARAARSVSTTARLRFRANIVAANWPLEAGAWAVAPPIVVEDEIDLGPDRPQSIKNRIDPVLTSYTYIYNEPGTYKVAFVASNVTTKGEAKVVKELEVVVP